MYMVCREISYLDGIIDKLMVWGEMYQMYTNKAASFESIWNRFHAYIQTLLHIHFKIIDVVRGNYYTIYCKQQWESMMNAMKVFLETKAEKLRK